MAFFTHSPGLFLNILSAICLSHVVSADLSVTILHTNDIHSHFDEFNPFGGECTPTWQQRQKCFGGYPRLAWKVNDIRQTESNVIVLDAGDQFQGTVWYTLFGHPIVARFMESVGYDVMALGNHEFDDGVDGLAPFLKNVSFPVISSNLDISREARLHGLLNDTHILTVGGQKIGIVGYITWMTRFISVPGPTLTFGAELEAIQEEVDKLTAQGVNKIIALGHSGYHVDMEIARRIRGVDIVIGGHTNTFLYTGTPPTPLEADGPYPTLVTSSVESGKTVLVVQDYQYALYLGYLKVTFDDAGNLVSWTGNPILLNNSVPKDPSLNSVLQDYKATLENRTSEIVGNTRVFMDNDDCKMKECSLGNMISDAFVYSNLKRSNRSIGWNDASICVINGGGLRNPFEEMTNNGNISLKNIIDVLPFMNTLDVVELTGDVIIEMLEHSVSLRGHPRFLQMSGVKVTFNMTKPAGMRVKDVEVRCSGCRVPRYDKLSRTESYRILTYSFLSNGGDGYDMLKHRRISYQQIGELDTDAVIDYLKHNTPVTVGLEDRIKIVGTENQGTSTIAGTPSTIPTTTDCVRRPRDIGHIFDDDDDDECDSASMTQISICSIVIALFTSTSMWISS